MGISLRAAAVRAAWLAPILLLGLALSQPQGVGQATQAETTMGLDADPAGNSATSLGNIEACISVASGEEFDVDIFVGDVTDLSGWQAILLYDGSMVSIVGTDTELLLAANDGSNIVDLSPDPLPDQDGLYTLAVADLGEGLGEGGSGLLARLTLEAVGPGASALALTDTILVDSAGKPIGDVNGDQVFDGPVSGIQVWVDEACPSGPLPTLTPPAAVITPPPMTPLPPGASPAAGTPAPPAAGGPTTEAEEDEGFPWAIAVVAGAGAALAALAVAVVTWRLVRRPE